MLERGIKLFSQNRFEEARSFFESLALSRLNSDETISYYHYILAIYKSINLNEMFQSSTLKYFFFLEKSQNYKLLSSSLLEYCVSYLSVDLNLNDDIKKLDSQLLQLGWTSFIKIGEVQLAKNFSSCLLYYHNQNRNFSAMLSHIEDRASSLSLDLDTLRWHLFALLYSGNILAFDQLLNKSINRGDKGTDEWIMDLCDDFRNMELYQSTLNDSLEYSIICLSSRLKSESLSDKKFVVNQLYRNLLRDPNDRRVIQTVLEYGIFAKSRKISEQVKQIVITNPSQFSRLKSVKEIFDSLIVQADSLDQYDDDTLEVDDNFDFATDLFSMSNMQSSVDGRDERGFEFLKSIGADDLAQDVREKLIEKQERDSDTSSIFGSTVNEGATNVIDDLIYNLEYFSKLYCNDSESILNNSTDDQTIASYLMHGGLGDLENNYSDIAVALNEMSLFSSALVVLEQAEKNVRYGERLEERIKHSYMKVEVLRALHRYGDAVALIEEMLTTWALVKTEILCFNYIAAELYQEMNDRGRALNHFLAVSSIDPTYRLVQQRLKEFE